jgi:sterol desaturase/sphingolipid hydroxylase (fatty acid hydroxylase superfamily)
MKWTTHVTPIVESKIWAPFSLEKATHRLMNTRLLGVRTLWSVPAFVFFLALMLFGSGSADASPVLCNGFERTAYGGGLAGSSNPSNWDLPFRSFLNSTSTVISPSKFGLHSPKVIVSDRNLQVAAVGSFQSEASQSSPTSTDSSNSKNSLVRRILGLFKKLAIKVFDLNVLRRLLFTYPLWVTLVITLTLERLIPAAPAQKTLSVSFVHDLMWFFYQPFLYALIIWTYVAFLEKVYGRYFSHFTYSGLLATPVWVRFLIGLLLLDLGYWVQHYFNHKVPLFWKFHKVHHSEQELNFFTDFRYHPLEYVVRQTFITIPFLFLSLNAPVIVGVAVFKEWYSRFYHGNIRTNLGPLKYVLVTPQSHRVHHSLEKKHQDLNFGSIFSIWDFLFQKQYKGFDEYPATGIEEAEFPREKKIGLLSVVLKPWQQMLHSFSRQSGDRPR